MSIGTNIKKLRRERDITQEQLAELLHLTPSAISQWETDRVLPDISYLPKLANLFRVSADVILGIDVASNDARIEEIYKEVRELWCTGQRDEAERLCREGLAEFPDAYILMEELAFNLSYSNDRAAQEESIELFERIRAGSNDEIAKNFAVGNLCSLYMAVGKPDVAKQLAESVPTLIYTKNQCLRMTLRGKDWAEEVRSQTAIAFDEFIWELRNLVNAFKHEHPSFTDEELIVLRKKIIAFVELFYEDGDYGFDRQLLSEAHFRLAVLYAKSGQPDAALDELEAMLREVEAFDTYSDGLLGNHVVLPPEKWPTSLLIRPTGPDDARLAMTNSSPTTENSAMDYLRQLSDKNLDSIRETERFQALEQRLRETARE